MKISLALSALLLSTLLHAESIDDALGGFDDDSTSSVSAEEITDNVADAPEIEAEEPLYGGLLEGFSGYLTQQGAIAYDSGRPQNVFNSLRQTLFLDYEHKFENGLKFKVNVRSFYDPIYDISNADYYPAEVDELNSEIELFEMYVEWNILDAVDVKLGRQVVVWGRSDTIRITDVLNPIDNRRPGIVDIEDLRLPTGMLKIDYQYGDWRISPIVIIEQRFSKDPPYGSLYNPITPDKPYSEVKKDGDPIYSLSNETYDDPTIALSVGGEFSGFDVNFYASRLYEDRGYVPVEQFFLAALRGGLDFTYNHNKTNMLGAAGNYLYGSWLLKAEFAYFSGLTYTSTQDRKLSRTDGMLGFEYNGIKDTIISYDFSMRYFNQYDERLFVPEENLLEQTTYQQAIRIYSTFLDDTLEANYLFTMFGVPWDSGDGKQGSFGDILTGKDQGWFKGGFQRAWIDYKVADAINSSFGVVDYMGGSPLFSLVEDQVVLFMDMTYSF